MAALYMFDGAYDAGVIAACKAAGGIAMSHYLSGPYAATSAAPHAIRAAGMGAVANWERMPGALVGATRTDGQSIARDALAGLPADWPRDESTGAYFSVDVSVPLGSISACDAGFMGINDVLGGVAQPRVYGEGALIDHLVAKHLVVGKQWLSASSSFPGYNPNDANVCMVQQVGLFVPNTDRNLVTDPHAIGAWWPDGSPYGGTMALSDDDKTWLDQHMRSAVAKVFTNDPQGLNDLWVKVNALPGDTAELVSQLPAPPLTDAQLAAIAAAVVAALPPSSGGGGVSKADVEAAVAAVLGRTGLSVGP